MKDYENLTDPSVRISQINDNANSNYVDILMNNANVGILNCRMDAMLSVLFSNPFFYKLIGYTKEEFTSKCQECFMQLVYNTDRLDFKQKIRKAVKNDTDIQMDIRLKRKDKQTFWVSFYGRIAVSQEGTQYLICMIRDIDHLHTIETQLKLQSDRYNVLKNITNEPIFEYDDLSDTMAVTLRKEEEPLILHNYRSEIGESGYIHPDDVKQYIQEFDQSLNQDQISVHEYRTNLVDGEYNWYRATYVNVMDSDTGMIKLIGKLENINKDKLHQQELLRKAMCDPMTGLLNRATAQKRIAAYLSEYSQKEHALIILDIDNFKMVNDNLGHLFGDTVLINFSGELRRIFCDDEILCRIGGDEFMAFVPNATREKLDAKLQEAGKIFDHVYSGNLNDINVSTSIGISMYPQDGTDYMQLFKCSDQALYYSKQQGKNQYHYYQTSFTDVLSSSDAELLDHYKMETREKRNNQETRDMIEFAFHILTETKEITSAIGLVLESLFKRLGIREGMLFESIGFSNQIKLSYFWRRGQAMLQDADAVAMDLDQWQQLSQCLLKHNQFQTGDREAFTEIPALYAELEEQDAAHILCDSIFMERELEGCLVVFYDDNSKEFTSDEKNMIHVIIKIIASYILQLRGRQRVNKKIDRLTNYDVVTGRYRLEKFKTKLRHILDEEEQSEESVYVLFYSDICNFKNINDIYGYSVGDQVLYELSEIIRKHKEYVIGCRDFADHFISLLRFQKHDNYIYLLLQIEQEFKRQQQQLLRHASNLSTGVYVIEDATMNVSRMIDNANLARKQVKEEINHTYAMYDADLAKQFFKNQQIESCMEGALQRGEFKVFLQPKYDLQTGRIVSAEALTRWQKSNQQYMYPDDFIPVFEKNGFITQVDFYVLEIVCQVLKERIREHQPYSSISINQSRYLLHDEHYVEKINHMLDQYDIPPYLLEFELTESLFFEDSKAMIDIMHRLKQLNVAVSIDDFGSGYSSLNVLKDVPADIIKIDKEFLSDGEDSTDSEIIIRKTIEMAKELHKKVVCEGVETAEQVAFLRNVGCDLVQGYYYARPMPMEEFFELLEEERRKENEHEK